MEKEYEINSWNTDTKELLNLFKGKIITSIRGLHEGSEEVTIDFEDSTIFTQYHSQDCCESVEVSQVDGEIERHIGATIIDFKEKVVTNDMPEYIKVNEYEESATATFYTLVTSKGYLDWRWQGESNGYYSESVDMKIITKKD